MEVLNNPTYFDESNTVAYYKLDGDATDSIGTNDGTPTNITWVDSERGYNSECGSFNGSSSEIDFSNTIIPTGAKSISFWIKSSSTATQYIIGNQRVTTLDNGSVVVYDNVNGPRYLIINSGTVLLNIDPNLPGLFNGDWQHLVYTWDGTTNTNGGKFYINGILHSQYTAIGSTEGTPSYNFTIGREPDAVAPDSWLNGQLGEVRIINKALSQQEIKNLYLQGLRKYGPTNQLPTYSTSLSPVAYYPLNGDTLDYAGSNDGTPTDLTYEGVWGGVGGKFNGSTSKINFGNKIIPIGEKTISVFVKTTSTGVLYIIGNCRISSLYNGTILWLNNGVVKFDVVDGTGTSTIQLSGTGTINDGKYHLLTITWDGTIGTDKCKLYIDGVLNSTYSPTKTTEPTAEANLGIGGSPVGTAYPFNGNISLVLIDNYAYSQTQITKLYNEGAKWILGNKYSLPNLRDGLVLDISKAQVGGVYYDQSGNGNNSSSVTAVTDTALGLNNVMSFINASSSAVVIPRIIDTNTGTCCCWFKIDTLKDYAGIIKQGLAKDSNSIGVTLTLSGGYRFLESSNSGTSVVNGNTTLSTGIWYFLAFTFTSTNATLYLNGVEDGTGSVSITNDVNHSFYIGRDEATSGTINRSFEGDIANVQVFNRALTANEIQQLYYSDFPQN